MRLLLAIFCCLLPLAAPAHIGSPNVFFEGNAGPYTVRVVIRPPATFPGVAQMDVRLENGTAAGPAASPAPAAPARVSIRPVYARAEGMADAVTVVADPTPGDGQLYNATFWLLARGSYAVHVSVQGAGGVGEVVVPLQVAAVKSPEMSTRLGMTLLALGALLLAAAVALARAAAREATLPDAAPITPRDLRRGRVATLSAVLVLALLLALGFVRYRVMVREFANNALARPVPISASVRTDDGQPVLTIAPTPENAPTTNWEGLVTDHGKLMHLFAIRDLAAGGPAAFAHLHPVRRHPTEFEGVLPPLPSGDYLLYGELTYQDGRSETLVGRAAFPEPAGRGARQGEWSMLDEIWCQSPLVLAGNAAKPTTLDYDDSWHVNPAQTQPGSRSSPLMGGNKMVFETPGALVANRDLSLRFMVVSPSGDTVAIQPYMGMQGHAVIRRNDGAVFTHLHPLGTISMAAQQVLSPGPPVANPMQSATTAREVTFPYAFPRGGNYRMWVQVRVAGRVLTGIFDVVVGEG